jgi:hypothetical protein
VAKRRTWALIALGCGAALFGAYSAQRSADELLVAGAGASAPSRSSAAIPGNLPERDILHAQKADLFAPPYVAPPPPPPPPPLAAAPELPSNPYRFAGTAMQDGEVKVFLASGDRVFEAKAGEMLDDFWRIKSVRPDSVMLLHVPTNVEQRVEIDSKLAPGG